MKLDVRKSGDVTVIDVSGTITMLDTPSPLKDRITTLVKDGERSIVLSLGHLTLVDSSCGSSPSPVTRDAVVRISYIPGSSGTKLPIDEPG